MGEWHVYVGSAPDDYVALLELPPSARIYRELRAWILTALRALLQRGRAALLLNPGEISSTRVEFLAGAVSMCLVIAARIGRNPAFRLGVGARDRRRPYSITHEVTTRLSTGVVWRDGKSRALFGRGEVAPDWAFALAPSGGMHQRGLVALSYRSDTQSLSDQALSAVQGWAEQRDLEVVVVTQVGRDYDSNAALARRLGVEHVASISRDLAETETLARFTYARCVVVLSNRIHVLILAAIEGASPSVVLTHPDIKVGRTLTTGHISAGLTRDDASPSDIHQYLDDRAQARSEVRGQVERAAADLSLLSDRILRSAAQ